MLPRPLALEPVADRLWAPPQEDVPTRGKPMSARVEATAVPYRMLVHELAARARGGALSSASRALGETSASPRAIRALSGIVAIRAALERRQTSVYDALIWFFGPRWQPDPEDAPLSAIDWPQAPDDRLVAMLPYVLDPFGLTTRRALLLGRTSSRERASRKGQGTFYTPGDLARSLAAEALTPSTRSVLDPACGAGVFLRAAFTRLCATQLPRDAVAGLHGIDSDACAIDACALVLLHDWLARESLRPSELPAHRFASLRSHLVHGDALELYAEPFQAGLFRDRRHAERPGMPLHVDAVLANPPFAPLGRCRGSVRDGYASLRRARNPGGVNMMWPFWELVSRTASRDGRAAIVLPLSAAYGSGEVADAGRLAAFARGSWELRFFDRAPDALFGDDVKQRVAVAIRGPGAGGAVRVTAIRRWSADRRSGALASRVGDGVELPIAAGPVAKIGSACERSALSHLRALGETLGDSAVGLRLAAASDLACDARAIAIAPTAYNWVGAYRDTATARTARRHAASKLVELTFDSRLLADAAYGVLASHVFLWWWRAIGDLFHMPLATLARSPFPLHRCSTERLSELARAARACWRHAQRAPIVAVNKSTRTVAYSSATDPAALAALDRAVGRAFGLQAAFVSLARDEASRLAAAGREP